MQPYDEPICIDCNSVSSVRIPLDRDAQLLAPMAWDALTETAREFWRDEARRRRAMIGE